MDVASKKFAYALMATSAALMAINFPFAKIDKISIPGTSVSVPAAFLWLFFIFLFVPFTNEIKASDLGLKYKLRKKFNSALATWSRKKKEKDQPELFTPQILVTSRNWNLKWVCKYCQAGDNLEPSYTAVSGVLNTIRLFSWAFIKVFVSTDTFERFTLPIALAVAAIAMKLYFLWANL